MLVLPFVYIRTRFQKIHPQHQSMAVRSGCLVVCVGPTKQRFMMKIEHVNHPIFFSLIEEANNKNEYYGSPIHNYGPIYIPCDVHVFLEALTEMDKLSHSDYSSFRIVPRCLMSFIRRLLPFKLNYHSTTSM